MLPTSFRGKVYCSIPIFVLLAYATCQVGLLSRPSAEGAIFLYACFVVLCWLFGVFSWAFERAEREALEQREQLKQELRDELRAEVLAELRQVKDGGLPGGEAP